MAMTKDEIAEYVETAFAGDLDDRGIKAVVELAMFYKHKDVRSLRDDLIETANLIKSIAQHNERWNLPE